MDYEKLLTRLTDATTEVATLKATAAPIAASLAASEARAVAAEAEVARLTAALAEAGTAANANAAAELTEARDALTAQYSALVVASGETAGEVPTTIADLKAGIDARTLKLTALIPVGGLSAPTGGKDAVPTAVNAAAFKINK